VFVGARELRLAVTPRGWRRRPPRRVVRELPDVAAAAADLAAALAAASARRGCEVRIALSNAHVRYAVVGDAGLLAGDAEREAAARQALRSVYGEAADGWRIVMDAAGGDAALVAGAPRSLIDGLRQACAGAGARRVRIEPLLSCAVNGALSALGGAGDAGWFGVLEGERLVLATLDGHGIRAVRSQRIRHDAGAEIAALLQRARLLDGDAAGRSTLVLAGERAVTLAPPSGLRVRTVPLAGMLERGLT
jgi:hypothetical protein